MTTQSVGTRLTITISDGVLKVRLRIRVRVLLALLAALAALTGSPALLAVLERLAG
jgi:hypothetical protein